MRLALFRKEALAARKIPALGTILMAQPPGARFLAALAAALAASLLAFFYLGEYTRKARVQGVVMPSGGLTKPQATLNGLIEQVLIAEGDRVQAGQPLVEISGEKFIGGNHPAQLQILDQLRDRKASLERDLSSASILATSQRRALEQQVANLQLQISQIGGEVRTQEERGRLVRATFDRMVELHAKQFVSAQQVQDRQSELLEQQARLQLLRRNQMALARDLAGIQNELEQLPIKTQAQTSSIERNMSVIDQDVADIESRRKVTVISPHEGHVTGIVVDAGQSVQAGQPLMTVIPSDSEMEVHLFAPSKAVGFIASGQDVLIRFLAFPYQKFGHKKGVVRQVSRTALTSAEVAPYLTGATSASDSLFRITVALDSQEISAYGVSQKLQPTLQVEADVLLDRRHLYEWALEPLYSISGRL